MVWQLSIKPTPVQIVRVDYPQRSHLLKIVEAYFRQASTTDYSGVYRGHYIDFEAKETRQKCYPNEELPSSPDSTYGTSSRTAGHLLRTTSFFFSTRNLFVAGT